MAGCRFRIERAVKITLPGILAALFEVIGTFELGWRGLPSRVSVDG